MQQAEVDFGDKVDRAAFEQILDMDEEDDRDFSRSIVFGFLEQAETTFVKMETALLAAPVLLLTFRTLISFYNSEEENLAELATLGHFLKGSSATLGFNFVKDECEKIQHYGHQKDETGEFDEPDKDKCLQLSKESIAKAKAAYREIEDLMKRYYGEAD